MTNRPIVRVHFSDYFGVAPGQVERHGAFNVSFINDIPLFIDPFLLFNSPRDDYQKLHEDMIEYLRVLRRRAVNGLDDGLIAAWYRFSEVKQTWLGYSERGNEGRGLGPDFAGHLHRSLGTVFVATSALKESRWGVILRSFASFVQGLVATLSVTLRRT